MASSILKTLRIPTLFTIQDATQEKIKVSVEAQVKRDDVAVEKMNEANSKQQQQQQASVSASAAGDGGNASPGPYSVAPSHMTDSMSRYGQAVGMGPDNLGGRNHPPGSGPPGPPPPALSPWQGYVYGVDPAGRGLAPFPGQPYRPPYQTFPGQYSEPFEQYLSGPLPPDYPINVRYPGDKGAENNGMGYAVMDNRSGGASSALPPFSTIATHPPSGGRGHTPGLKDELGEFSEGLGARLTRSGSVGTPTPGGEFGDALGSRLERSLSREDAYNSSSSLVQYRPWEIGGAGRGEPPSSSHASPTSPSSSYSFAEGFLKFQPGSLMADKGGQSNNVGNNSAPAGGNANSGGADGSSPGATVGDDKSWYHAKGDAPSPYSKDSSALPHPPPPPNVTDKHVAKDSGQLVNSAHSGKSSSSNNNNAANNNNNNNNNDIMGGEPNRPPASSSVGYSGDGSSGAEDGKGHMGSNSYPQYDQRDMLLSFGSPHQTAAYDYYPPNPASGGGPWGYSDMATKTPNYHAAGRPYTQNGRENVYGNGNPPDRTYQLSPHEKLSLQTTHTPSPPGGGPGGGYQANNAHVPLHTVAATSTTKKGRGRGARGGGVDRVGQVPSVSSSMHGQGGANAKNNPLLGHDEYGPTSAKQAALASAADDPVAPTDKPKKKKRKRCGECYGCQRKDNCGECAPCRNEKSHQICKMRRCEKLIEKKGNNNNTPAPATPPATHVQPPPPPPPTVSEKMQYLGASAGAGTAWW